MPITCLPIVRQPRHGLVEFINIGGNMSIFIKKQRFCLFYRLLSAFIAVAFVTTTIIPRGYANTMINGQGSVLSLPIPGTMVTASEAFVPTLIKGITIHPENPLQFNFIVDTGNTGMQQGKVLEDETTKLVKYFLAALTVPEQEMWVNLSPYEENRIIADGLGDTELGRDMLAQDYLLKQLTSSLMYPEDELGERFWDRVYARAQEEFGTTDIPMNTFNKVWIVPEKAVVFEDEKTSSTYVLESHLKVMLEEDYVTMEHNTDRRGLIHQTQDKGMINHAPTDIIREILIPEIEREVNHGKTFANLRQIYNSMILATWYKQNLKQSLLGQVYIDQNKTKGIDTEDKKITQKIYNQYVESFQKGVYDYIKEDYDPVTQQIVPRKYFSGGLLGPVTSNPDFSMVVLTNTKDIDRSLLGKNPQFSALFNLADLGGESKSILEITQAVNNATMIDKYMVKEKVLDKDEAMTVKDVSMMTKKKDGIKKVIKRGEIRNFLFSLLAIPLFFSIFIPPVIIVQMFVSVNDMMSPNPFFQIESVQTNNRLEVQNPFSEDLFKKTINDLEKFFRSDKSANKELKFMKISEFVAQLKFALRDNVNLDNLSWDMEDINEPLVTDKDIFNNIAKSTSKWLENANEETQKRIINQLLDVEDLHYSSKYNFFRSIGGYLRKHDHAMLVAPEIRSTVKFLTETIGEDVMLADVRLLDQLKAIENDEEYQNEGGRKNSTGRAIHDFIDDLEKKFDKNMDVIKMNELGINVDDEKKKLENWRNTFHKKYYVNQRIGYAGISEGEKKSAMKVINEVSRSLIKKFFNQYIVKKGNKLINTRFSASQDHTIQPEKWHSGGWSVKDNFIGVPLAIGSLIALEREYKKGVYRDINNTGQEVVNLVLEEFYQIRRSERASDLSNVIGQVLNTYRRYQNSTNSIGQEIKEDAVNDFRDLGIDESEIRELIKSKDSFGAKMLYIAKRILSDNVKTDEQAIQHAINGLSIPELDILDEFIDGVETKVTKEDPVSLADVLNKVREKLVYKSIVRPRKRNYSIIISEDYDYGSTDTDSELKERLIRLNTKKMIADRKKELGDKAMVAEMKDIDKFQKVRGINLDASMMDDESLRKEIKVALVNMDEHIKKWEGAKNEFLETLNKILYEYREYSEIENKLEGGLSENDEKKQYDVKDSEESISFSLGISDQIRLAVERFSNIVWDKEIKQYNRAKLWEGDESQGETNEEEIDRVRQDVIEITHIGIQEIINNILKDLSSEGKVLNLIEHYSIVEKVLNNLISEEPTLNDEVDWINVALRAINRFKEMTQRLTVVDQNLNISGESVNDSEKYINENVLGLKRDANTYILKMYLKFMGIEITTNAELFNEDVDSFGKGLLDSLFNALNDKDHPINNEGFGPFDDGIDLEDDDSNLEDDPDVGDDSMITQTVNHINNPGGINLDAAMLDLQIRRDGNGVPLPVAEQDFSTMHIEGFLPIMIDMAPVSIPMLLGFADEDGGVPVTGCPSDEEGINCNHDFILTKQEDEIFL